ncbi:hypothetical protein [Knoellia sp. Soil729]|uniref:hypothetical protein n=1 Tax=Knoellia sp. Soil729 TaxID=1736394 RepID=UPI0006F2B51D|nr:hypothetical protein [Knoellia sp. Soil729]KRE43819.1 hypothetical protein ASG74_02985 [Knoellia sp. Soil729]
MPWIGPAVAATASLAILLWSLPRGLDLTDEGYYLTEIAHPGDSTATALLFGWVWHPVYAVLGGSVVGLRLVSSGLVALLTASLTLAVLRLAPSRTRPGRFAVACVCAVAVALAFLPMSTLPATPSYNTLTWLAMAAAALGCVWAWSGRRPMLGGALVGAAGAAAVMGKPTTALVLGAAVLFTTPWRRTGPRPVLAALAVLVTCLAALVMVTPGHLAGLVEVVQRGVEATVGHARLVRRDPFLRSAQVFLGLGAAALGGAAAGLLGRHRPVVGLVLGSVSVAVAVASLWRWRDVGMIASIDLLLPTAALTLFGLLGAVAVVLVMRGGDGMPGPETVRIRLVVLLVLLPLAYAFGTNNNLWHWSGQCVVFWFLAVLLLVGTTGAAAAAAGGLAAYTALVSAVITPLDPYRSTSLTKTVDARVSHDGTMMRLPPQEAGLVTQMLDVGDRLGVTRSTKVLDLTGASPGVVWAWGARPLASGWVIGGYPESLHAARTSIAPARCDLDRALVLWAPEQPRAIPDEVLEPFGVELPGDYRVVATFPGPRPAPTAGDPAPHVPVVSVLEPVSVSPTACAGP